MNGMYPNNPMMMGQPVFSPYVNQIPVNPAVPNYPVVQQPAPHREADRVNGKESAYAFAMGPNSSAVLIDNLAPKVYLVTTDSSGYKAVTGYRIVPDEDEPIQAEGKVEETKEDPIKALADRIDKLEERMNSYGQSNAKSSWQSKSGNAGYQPNDRNGQNGKGSDGRAQQDGGQ